MARSMRSSVGSSNATTETLGSILSPARQCGVTGLRPTYGRVSRHGAMSLAWTMDKLGPIARTAFDAGIVLAAIAGPDGLDETVSDEPRYVPTAVDPRGWRIGVVEAAFEAVSATGGVLDELRGLGCDLVRVDLPDVPIDDGWVILEAEAAASFDELTRDGRVRDMVRQEDEAWPNVFRAARLIPAVEYLRANRVRRAVMLEMDERMRDVDLLVHPSDEDATLTVENLTGHPAVSVPWGRRDNGAPDAVAFAGHLDREPDLVGFVAAWQSRTEHHLRRPPI